MKNTRNKLLYLLYFSFYCCFPAGAQLSFKIDSLSCMCYGCFECESSWESEELSQRGPGILVYGVLTNNSDSPVIPDLIECRPDADTIILHKMLCFVFSYHHKDTLISTDCFPLYWKEEDLPFHSIRINEKDLGYSIIGAGESIPLAFVIPRSETELMGIDPPLSKAYKNRRRFQKRVSNSIKTSLKIIPFLKEFSDSPEQFDSLLSSLPVQHTEESQDEIIPQGLIDTKPIFIDGGLSGFDKWLKVRWGEIRPELSGQESTIHLYFDVDKNGEVINTEMFIPRSSDNKRLDELLKKIILQSPKWIPGEQQGKKVDTRIGLTITTDEFGDIHEISMF